MTFVMWSLWAGVDLHTVRGGRPFAYGIYDALSEVIAEQTGTGESERAIGA